MCRSDITCWGISCNLGSSRSCSTSRTFALSSSYSSSSTLSISTVDSVRVVTPCEGPPPVPKPCPDSVAVADTATVEVELLAGFRVRNSHRISNTPLLLRSDYPIRSPGSSVLYSLRPIQAGVFRRIGHVPQEIQELMDDVVNGVGSKQNACNALFRAGSDDKRDRGSSCACTPPF